ncbi:glycoside hydrolase family 2 protein [Caldicellulosiruptoraceae bacterium PP1]
MTQIPRQEYPRPNFKREQWMNLNGEWEFEFDDNNLGEKERWFKGKSFSKRIIVPFTYETKLSGINIQEGHNYVWYKRTFSIPKDWEGKNIILNFGAVDYKAKIWVNEQYLGSHVGGYTPFSFDITNYIDHNRENTVYVKAEDEWENKEQARGKQSWIESTFACWYTRTTGIWQTVWLEPVDERCIANVKMKSVVNKGMIDIEANLNFVDEEISLQTDIYYKGEFITSTVVRCTSQKLRFSINVYSKKVSEWGLMLWHPDHPNLYDIEFKIIDNNGKVYDDVKSYFGMREIRVIDGKVLLNGEPIYQRLILDQGYWPDSNITPPDEESIIYDIKMTKEFGFNGVRKHQKAEDPLFLYWADRLGLLVWGEMASFYEFSDTAMKAYMQEWQEVIERDYNHPCIITWTPFNESWGIPNVVINKDEQDYTVAVVNMIRALDTTRPVVSNDGWEHTDTDLLTIHDYEQDAKVIEKKYSSKEDVISRSPIWKRLFAQGYTYKGQPILLTEYGGIAYATSNGWGYGKSAESEEEFIERFKALHDKIKSLDYICGYCYTQLTDVQQEINGLMTYDRKPKVDTQKIRNILKP